MRKWASQLSGFVDGFVPPSLPASSDEGDRARLALRVTWLMVLVFLVLAATHALAGSHREAVINVALSLMMLAGPYLVRRTGRFSAVLNVILALVFAAVVALSVTARGAGLTAATVALAEVPLFATLLGGVRVGAAWAALSVAAGALIGLLGRAGLITDRAPAAGRLFDEHASLAIITATLFGVAVLYERRKAAALRTIAALDEERRRAEADRIRAAADAEVSRAERLASLGRIAASAAHEINNPLSFVTGGIEHAAANLPPSASPEVHEALADALDGARRIRRIVEDLRAGTRPEEEPARAVDAARAARTALKMAEGHTRPRARVRVELPELPRVVGEESRLVQVFLNLVVNAAEAIPEGRRDAHEIAVTGRREGDAVVVEVRDTGAGIPPDLLARVKEPFFTTKPVGEGTGLGLSLCDNIVRSFGGSIDIESRPGATAARVTLRVSPEPAPAEPPPPAPPRPSAPGTLRVLVVDDEPLVARALARMLRPHDVTVASSGRDALRCVREARFDVIFCDLMMPDLSGMDVYDALRGTDPSVADAIVFMSGGAFTDRAAAFRAGVANRFLAKPIDRDAVERVVAERLAAAT